MRNKLKYLTFGFLALAGCALVGVGHTNRSLVLPKNESDYAKTAVMITSENMKSGGTGVILDSRPGASYILTNMHVCQLIQIGGRVVTDDGAIYPVEGYRVYKKHDLCLVNVTKDLHVKVKVADKAPEVYSPSIVVGHPALLPTMVTPGHFSKWQTIQLIVDMQACDGTEGEDEAIMCMFMGSKPILKTYSAQPTTSLIMPGSSGSGVFNDKGELSGLIFAGSQGLSYGFMVPWEYIHDFLSHIKQYPVQIPDAKKKPTNFFTSYFKFEKICDDKISYTLGLTEMCNSVARIGLYHGQ